MNTTKQLWNNLVIILKYTIVSVIFIYGTATVIFILASCSYTIPSNKIMDRDKYAHDYNQEITIFNNKQSLYCKSHYRWETVKMINTKHGVTYIVRSK